MSKLTTEEVAYYVNEIRDSGYEPNEWEEKSLASMDTLVEKGWEISEKQIACLMKIYERATE